MPTWRFHALGPDGWADLPTRHTGTLASVLIRCGELSAELGTDVCAEPLEDPMDRSAFYAAIRHDPFPGKLTLQQVDGMDAILDAAPPGMNLPSLAYCLCTAFHETAATMQPIKEYGGPAYFFRMYDPKGDRPSVAKALGNTQPGDGVRFAGRGYVQLTGRANYLRAGKVLGIDLIAEPDRAMEPALAARIMFEGMAVGWFTGKRLSDYFLPPKHDPVNARRIINGTDKAALIAGYHAEFAAALQKAGYQVSGLDKPAALGRAAGHAQPDAPVPVAPAPKVCPTCGKALAA